MVDARVYKACKRWGHRALLIYYDVPSPSPPPLQKPARAPTHRSPVAPVAQKTEKTPLADVILLHSGRLLDATLGAQQDLRLPGIQLLNVVVPTAADKRVLLESTVQRQSTVRLGSRLTTATQRNIAGCSS